MPVYEFYCSNCHMVFNFFSKRVNTKKRPSCPRCGKPRLERQVSIFAISKGRKEQDGGDPFADMDEGRLEGMLQSLASEADNLNEDDPKQVAGLMRKLYEGAGIPMGRGMKEALKRLEAGEDPDAVEEDLGDVLEQEGESLFTGDGLKAGVKALKKKLPPQVDETLYDL